LTLAGPSATHPRPAGTAPRHASSRSSRGPGHQPFTLVTRVRIPYGTPSVPNELGLLCALPRQPSPKISPISGFGTAAGSSRVPLCSLSSRHARHTQSPLRHPRRTHAVSLLRPPVQRPEARARRGRDNGADHRRAAGRALGAVGLRRDAQTGAGSAWSGGESGWLDREGCEGGPRRVALLCCSSASPRSGNGRTSMPTPASESANGPTTGARSVRRGSDSAKRADPARIAPTSVARASGMSVLAKKSQRLRRLQTRPGPVRNADSRAGPGASQPWCRWAAWSRPSPCHSVRGRYWHRAAALPLP
jgi:hypothetical protein